MEFLKGILIILDGLGDRPTAALNQRTPLEASRTPNLDAAATKGLTGLMHPLLPWLPVGTQVGMGLLMGLPPQDVKILSRGPVEAAGAGLDLQDGDIALRCNFATLQQNGDTLTILNRRAGRISEQREALRDALNTIVLGNDIQSNFALTTGHRGVLVLSGSNLSDRVSDTDPGAGYESHGLRLCVPLLPEAAATADAINSFIDQSHAVLDAHPVNQERRSAGLPAANGILTRGAGHINQLRNQLRHLGLRSALVTGERTAVGLGRLFGFDVVHQPTFTATPDTDLAGKVAATFKALEDHDMVFLHIKAPDIFSHDGNPKGKKACLEDIDSQLAPLLKSEHVVVITGDHSTDSTLERHIGDPVPTILQAPHSRQDDVAVFTEQACQKGGLGSLSATDLLTAMLDHMNRLPNYSSQDYLIF